MKVLLITQYKENILNNTLPSDGRLYRHYETYHHAVYNALIRNNYEVCILDGTEPDFEQQIKIADVVFPIRHDFGYINGDLNVRLICHKHNKKCVGNTSYSKFYDTDKIVGKLLAQTLHIETPRYCMPYAISDIPFDPPYIIKPRFFDSSQDILPSRVVKSIDRLKDELREIQNLNRFFIEEYIYGVTATIACLNYGNNFIFSHPYTLKSKTNKQVITFEDKRIGNTEREYIQNEKLILTMKEIAKRYFVAVQPCQIGRIDFMLTQDNRLYFLEINTTPNLGQTNGVTVSYVNDFFGTYDNYIDYLVKSAIVLNK